MKKLILVGLLALVSCVNAASTQGPVVGNSHGNYFAKQNTSQNAEQVPVQLHRPTSHGGEN